MKPFIGLKKLWYGDPLTKVPSSIEELKTSSMSEIKNVHNGTWNYSQDDPEITDYINELTGGTYFRDMVAQGNKVINFTIGEYEFATRVALQGGKYENGVWEAPKELALINKCIVAQTKTGHYICFPNASIIAKVDTQEKNLGLGLVATALEDEANNLADEYWFNSEYK